MTSIHLDTGAAGYLPLLPPWPSLGGALYAGYMFGHRYAEFATPWAARTIGVGYDWSGNGRHIINLAELASLVADFGVVAAPALDEPVTPFTRAQIYAANSAFSIVALAHSIGTARTVALARDQVSVTTPKTSLTLFPQSSAIRASATTDGTTGFAQVTLTGELGAVSLYGGTFAPAARTVFSKTGVAATKTATESTTLTSLSDDEPFEIADEAGDGTGNTTLYGLAFYNRVITQAEFDAMLLRQRAFNAAVAVTGITV